MKKVTLLAAAAAVSALVATPVMARDTVKSKSGTHMKSTKHHARMQNRAMYRDRTAYRGDTGYAPGAVAGGIVGGALGTAGAVTAGALDTAGAIATAPFGGPGYYNSGYSNRGPYYGDAGSYPYGYRSRYGGAYASTDMGWGNPGYGGGYGYATYNYDGVAISGSPDYDARNGFTCRPGSVTKSGAICQ